MAGRMAIRTVRRMTTNPEPTATTPASHPATALVTGASRGLGLALARRLAADGWPLVIDGRDPATLHAAATELASHRVVRAIPGDITSPRHREHLAAAAGELGGLDLVVHNAGALGPSPLPPVDEVALDAVRDVLEANVVAPLALTQVLLPHLRSGAVVVAITSDAAAEAYAGWGTYGASKAAFEQLFAVLAEEHPELRVLRIDPGDLRTDMHQAAFPGEDISDRPLPAVRVPAIVDLVAGAFPSGRYQAAHHRQEVPA
jgi:NAD(P)-dependent dehydrogenase (short-subunit alcohol dehydrogenase family)